MALFLFLLFSHAVAPSYTDVCNDNLYDDSWTEWKSTWSAVPENQWGYDFDAEEAINADPTTTPCGFKTAQIQEDNNPGFCLTVPAVQDTNVQLLLESEEPNVRMCVKTTSPGFNPQASAALEETCGEGRLRVCFPAESQDYASTQDGGISELRFYVYTNPAGAELSFYYKVDHSMNRNDVPANTSAISNVDMWCAMIEGTKTTLWPDACIHTDFQTPPPTPPNDELNSANCVGLSGTFAFVLLALLSNY